MGLHSRHPIPVRRAALAWARTCFVLKAQSCFGHHISCDAYQAAQKLVKIGNYVFLGKGPFYGEFVDKSGKAFYNALNASRGLLVNPLFNIREDMDYGRS